MNRSRLTTLVVGAVLFGMLAANLVAEDWIVSANDAKYQRVKGLDTYPEAGGPDTLTLLNASHWPPIVKTTVAVEHTIAGPPQAVAITPDGSLAVVSAPNRYDRGAGRPILDTFLQIVDLSTQPARVVNRVELEAHPQGLAINRAGNLLLAATLKGTVAVLSIHDRTVHLLDQFKVSNGRLAGITFTHDGKAALVCRRDEQGIAVLEVNGQSVRPTATLISTGIAPYSIDVSSDGRWAVVSNVGLAGINAGAPLVGDADSCTLIDVRATPFRAVQYLTVPSAPEGVAISPDGRWVAVQSMGGSQLPTGNPGRRPKGVISLFEIKQGKAVWADAVPAGEASQGIVFTQDSRHILVQFNVEKLLALMSIVAGRLSDQGERIPLSGGPASIRSQPR